MRFFFVSKGIVHFDPREIVPCFFYDSSCVVLSPCGISFGFAIVPDDSPYREYNVFFESIPSIMYHNGGIFKTLVNWFSFRVR